MVLTPPCAHGVQQRAGVAGLGGVVPCQGHPWVLCCARVCALRVCDRAVGHIGVLCHNKGGDPPTLIPWGTVEPPSPSGVPPSYAGCSVPTHPAVPGLAPTTACALPQFPQPHAWAQRGPPSPLWVTTRCLWGPCPPVQHRELPCVWPWGGRGLLCVGKLRQGETKPCLGRGCPQPRATHGRSPDPERSLWWRSVGSWGARRCWGGFGERRRRAGGDAGRASVPGQGG